MNCTLNAPRPTYQCTETQQNSLGSAAVRCAAALNSEGASHLANGDLQRAYGSFKSALEIVSHAELSLLLQLPQNLNSMTPTPSAVPQQSPQYPASEQQQVQQQVFPSKELQMYATLTQQTDDILRQNPPSFQQAAEAAAAARTPFKNSTFFVYNEPFLFAPPATAITADRMALHKAQILFNLAVVLHQGGNCVDENSVFQALRLYDLCLECTISLADSQEGLVVTIASLNNKAHIFHEFCEGGSLQVVLDTLYMAMVFLPKGVELMNSTYLQGILFNVYMLRDLYCARAA